MRRLLACVMGACLVVVLVPAVMAASPVAARWRADVPSGLGAGTVSLLTDGTGSVAVSLRGLPKGGKVALALGSGLCLQPTKLFSLFFTRATSTGTIKRTLALSAAKATRVRLAEGRVLTVQSGGRTACYTLRYASPVPAGGFAEGTWHVGRDIAPGTYRTRLPEAACHWQRLSGTDGADAQVIAEDAHSGWSVVTIAATDVAFQTDGCAAWSPDLSAVTGGRIVGNGVFIVGTDIQPGMYRSTGPGECRWERTSGFGGTVPEVIADGSATGPTTVTVAATDVGFAALGCGAWASASQ